MSLKYALLGFLNYGSMTGYELKRHIDESTQNLWHASLSQIYPMLQKLEREGLVSSTEMPQSNKPDRKYYQIEAPGRAAFRKWLEESDLELVRQKNINLLKLFFAGSLPKPQLLHNLQTQLNLHRQRLAYYQQETREYIAEIVGGTEAQKEAIMWKALHNLGVEIEKATIRWLERTIKIVEAEFDE